jgi:drug/metabolite transporter (DMT)-like permease
MFLIALPFQKVRIPAIADWPGITALALFGFALYNLLINYGEKTVDAGSSSFIINTVPFFTLLFAIVTKAEVPKTKDWTGMLIALTGVGLIILSKNNDIHTFNWGMLLILAAAICQALYLILQKKYLRKYTPFELTAYAVWIGTLLMALTVKKPFLNISSAPLPQTLAIVYLGIFPGAVAFFLIGLALKKYQLSTISSYLFLIPFITIFIAWAALNEMVSLTALTGGLFIVFGIVIKNKIFGTARPSVYVETKC